MTVSEGEQIAAAKAAGDRERLLGIASQQQARLRWLASLATAEDLGRIVEVQQSLLDELRPPDSV